jgi:hypothetical protein
MSATLRGLGLCIDDLGSTFASTTAPPVAPGTIVEDDSGHAYMFVYNTGSTSITQYYGAFHTNTSTLAYIANTGLATGMAMAGVAMTAIDSANYGWVCVRGLCTAYASAAVATIGWAVRGGTLGVHACTQYQEPHVGYAVVTNTAAGTGLIVKLNIA